MDDLEIIRRARSRAHLFASDKTTEEVNAGAKQAAIDGYLEDGTDVVGHGETSPGFDSRQQTIYRYAFAGQLVSLGI